MTSGGPEAFGFVPAHVVADLQDIGNWKSRATAIDALHKCLKDVARPAVLVPSLPDFVNFLVALIADPNFKISISAMSILGDLAGKVGDSLKPHVRVVVPALLEKFSDNKIMVRSANMKAIRRLMQACSPGPLLTLLAESSSHSNARTREEVVNVYIMAMLSFDRSAYDPIAIYRHLSSCLSDGRDRLKMVALEGLALLNIKLGGGELAAMMAGQQRGAPALPEAVRLQVAARLARPGLPGLNAEGLIEHVAELPQGDNPDARLMDAAAMGGGAGGKPSWADAATPARLRPRNPGGSDGPDIRPWAPSPSLEQVGRMGSDPLPGGRRHAPQQQQQYPGHLALGNGALGHSEEAGGVGGGGGMGYRSNSLQPFAPTPSRFGSHESLCGGAPTTSPPAPATSNGLGSGPQGYGGVRSASPLREQLAGHQSALLPGEHSQGLAQERNTHSSALQPLKHHWGASRSLESQGAAMGRSPGEHSQEDGPLSPTRGYQPLIHSRHSGPAGTGDGSRDSLDLIPRPASVRTQAAQELRDGRGPAPYPHSHHYSQPPAHQPQQQPHGGAQQPSSLGLWLQSSLEQDGGVNRQETFSPSKAEMLARLKNRQIEKRAATAQMDSSFGSASELSLANSDLQQGGLHSFTAGQQQSANPRRHLFTQLSDHQRDRDAERSAECSRGYNSVVNAPTRAQGGGGGAFDDAPASAQSHRPPRGALAARLGRVTPASGEGGSGVGQTRSPTMAAHNSPAPSEESPMRTPSPAALNRLRVRSADPVPATSGGTGGAANAVPNTPIAGANATAGAYWEKGRAVDFPQSDLTPVADPERHIKVVISRLLEANRADRKELDWEGQYDALVDARRLVRHHLEVVRGCLHEFVRAATPAIDQLRSQTAKCALTLFQESFMLLGRAMDRELDELVPVLIKKAGEVSNAGRDNFLAAEADRALGEMYRCCGESRCVMALLGCAGHKNPFVRGKVAFHLDNHLEACAGGGGRQALAGNSTCMERLFKAAAAFLDEGSLDTRTYGKRIIWHLKAMVASRSEFDRLVNSVSPESLRKKVLDVVEGLNGPPPPPSRAAAGGGGGGAVGSRLASRQVGGVVGGGGGPVPVSPARPLLDQGPGSLTAPPPPVRHGSYSAPSPLHSGAATPERRRLGQQRTNDLDGIPEGGSAGGLSRANSGSGRLGRVSAGAGGAGSAAAGVGRTRHAASADGSGPAGYAAGTGGSFGPVAQETLVKALQLLSAKDFRERVEALRSVEGVVSALPGAPDTLLMQLLDALVARLGDANSKVSMVALELVSSLALALRQRMSLGLNTLVPALAAALGSANDKIRGVAIAATDSLLGTLDPAMLVQHFSHCVGNGTLTRGKPILVDKLVQIVNGLYGTKPQLVARYAVPAAFAMLNDSRGGGEAKAAANALLSALARLMGGALLDQAGSLNALAQQRVADAVAAAAAGYQPHSNPHSHSHQPGLGAPPERERDRTPRHGGMLGRAMA